MTLARAINCHLSKRIRKTCNQQPTNANICFRYSSIHQFNPTRSESSYVTTNLFANLVILTLTNPRDQQLSLLIFLQINICKYFNLWHPLLPYGYSYEASCNFWHPGTLTLSRECQSAWMSKITVGGLTVSGTGCFTLCSEKKHPLTFSFISPWMMCGFKQKLQYIYPRKGRFWQCRN